MFVFTGINDTSAVLIDPLIFNLDRASFEEDIVTTLLMLNKKSVRKPGEFELDYLPMGTEH